MYYILAIVVAIVGALIGGFGILGCADPEGRGGNFIWLVAVGAIIFLISVACLLWMGFCDIKALPYFNR